MQKVVDTIKIEKFKGGAFNVVQGDRYSDTLSYDEMLGLVSALTIAKEPMCLSWMQTKEEHEQSRINIQNMSSKVEFEYILVPKNIHIYRNMYVGGDYLQIAFSEDKQFLYFEKGIFKVGCKTQADYLVQCKLIPCKYEDLNPGDTAFALPKGIKVEERLHRISNYFKILGNKKVVSIMDESVITAPHDMINAVWHKVDPV